MTVHKAGKDKMKLNAVSFRCNNWMVIICCPIFVQFSVWKSGQEHLSHQYFHFSKKTSKSNAICLPSFSLSPNVLSIFISEKSKTYLFIFLFVIKALAKFLLLLLLLFLISCWKQGNVEKKAFQFVGIRHSLLISVPWRME